ncbi:hypothetical protein A2V68_00635 [candidate division Kazan bacterium RBG_13_50_9]|uniref:O-antigen ligase-related domain-containing protein n=1 Tax=candidate division Kazan bacterium RBG_13_50_9 TaxID=1798535 RepID=A0A1F4NS69_UNCK3|nr:MAG: hypothetical protein A2V68_00635 [candidate division Kazan bacterium RBG_13_50_9]
MAIYIYLVVFLAVYAGVAWRNLRVALYLILMLLPTYLFRLSVWFIPTTLLELVIYTAFVVWLVAIFRGRATFNWLEVKRYLASLGLLAAGLVVGTLISTDQLVSVGIIKGWFLDPLLLWVMLVSVLERRVHVKKAIIALMISGVLLSLFALYQVVSGDFVTIDDRASALFSSANYLSLYLVPIIILGVGLLLAVHSQKRWWVVISLILMLVALYFSFSYGGWLALVGGIGFLMLITLPWLPTLIGIGVVVVVGIISQWQHPKFQQMLDLVERSSSSVRLEVWQTAWLMIRENYLAGIGLGLFEQRYPAFVSRLFHPPLEPSMLHAHNVFMQFWINSGLLGLIGFIGVLVTFFGQIGAAFKSRRHVLTGAVMAAMVALLVHGLIDTPYWKNDLAALFWAIVAFGIILSQNATLKRSNLSDRD